MLLLRVLWGSGGSVVWRPQCVMRSGTGRVKRAAFGFRRFAHNRIRAVLYAGKPNWTLLSGIIPRWDPKRPLIA